MELLTPAAPVVMLALLTLTVSVCYIMLLRQESETSFVSRYSLRPSAACPTCLTIEIVINQSVCLFSNQFSLQKHLPSLHTIMPYGWGWGPKRLCVCVCVFVWLLEISCIPVSSLRISITECLTLSPLSERIIPPPSSSLYLKAFPTRLVTFDAILKSVTNGGGTGWSSPKPPEGMNQWHGCSKRRREINTFVRVSQWRGTLLSYFFARLPN